MDNHPPDNNRRRLLAALAGTGVLAGLDALTPNYALAQPRHSSPIAGLENAQVESNVPHSSTVDLHIRNESISIAGGHGNAFTVNHSVPGPLIELWEGQQAHLRVHNHMDQSTSVHWHGILLPFQMDGVPGVSFPGIGPRSTFEADFHIRQHGTYWYHSHTGGQEQKGLNGPLIIHPKSSSSIHADRDYVVMLNDWTFEDPSRILSKLKSSDDYYNYHQRTVGDFFSSVEKNGFMATVHDRLAWGNMRMSPRDIADVTGATYTFLMNGHHPAKEWEGLFKPNEHVRLRVINGSSMTYFNFRIPGLEMKVVAADGREIEPITTDEFQIAVAETYDVIVKPKADRAYTLMAESMDRSGYTVGTLAPRSGMRAPIPALRKPPQRTMIDMGMAMNMPGMKGNDKSMPHHMDSKDQSMPHHKMNMDGGEMSGHSMAMDSHGKDMHHPGMDMSGNDMMSSSPIVARNTGQHDYGVENIAHPEVYRDRLGEPGAGLDNVGHRTLDYKQLRNVIPMQDRREPQQTIEVHLTGNMNRYMWSFDGKKYTESTPIDMVQGDRIRLVMYNDTMMEHPMHLHGMFMELENDQGERLPFKHTISVLPASRVSVLITADAPGRWAFHCHLLYHMEAGMFRVVRVAPKEELQNV